MALPKPQPPDEKQLREWRQWVDALLDRCSMSSWEQNFVEDMERKLACGIPLSLKQAEVLERIYVQKG